MLKTIKDDFNTYYEEYFKDAVDDEIYNKMFLPLFNAM
jgi:hypothetical protein